ncbi:uncharacterized protein [Spinacia oleracea]|uniref:Agenet domain-containing protein n=1 Tax=Spinacia oleracea TaxID=3562 RepID=A0A9R0K6C5_SPIOL|nr:uncharacterized protein LOC110799227 [Spinacia oleracea]
MAGSNNDEIKVNYRPKKEQGSRQPPRQLEGDEENITGWLSDYGWIKVQKITNKSSHTLEFTNPYEARLEDEIESGQSESKNCVGYLPYDGSSFTYEIKYYNTMFDEWTKLVINDIERDWLMSTSSVRDSKTDEPDEDVREVSPNPAALSDWAKIEFVVNDDGYEIYDPTWNSVIASLTWTNK